MQTTHELRSADGTRLHAVGRWPGDDPAGIVLVCHGLGEHAGRYDHVLAAINDAGAAAVAVDLRGHGRSAGKRGHTAAWGRYVEDVAALFDLVEDGGLTDRPCLLLGHSMGGLVAVHTALKHQTRLAGLILSGPLLGVATRVPAAKAAAGRVLSRLVPALTMSNELDSRWISHDPAVVRAYEADPLVHDRVSTRWFTEMLAALDRAHARAGELILPLLLLHGSDDRLTDPEGSRRWLEAYGGPNEAHFLAGFYHEVFNEVDRQAALDLMTGFIRARLRDAPRPESG